MGKYLILCYLFLFNLLYAGDTSEKISLGFNVNAQKLYGDTRFGKFIFGVNPAIVRYNFQPYLFLESELGLGRLTTQKQNKQLTTDFIQFGIKTGVRPLGTFSVISPIFYIGGGILNFKLDNWPRFWDGYGVLGGGLEFFFKNYYSINLTGDFRYTTGDDFDGGDFRKRKDSFVNIGLGFMYHIGGRRFYMPKTEFSTTQPEELNLQLEKVAEDSTQVAEESGKVQEKLEIESLARSLNQKLELVELFKVKNASLDEQLIDLQNQVEEYTESFSENEQNYLDEYELGLNYYRTGEYTKAIIVFKELIDGLNNPHFLTNCYYWLGECYFASEQYSLALESFQRVVDDSQSIKNVDALFM
ncbi:MAG: hypothetical protein D6813_15795, partial [Calditrichaeota bacterium]